MSVYTVHNSKICLPKSTNAEEKKKKKKTENVSRKREAENVDTESKRSHSVTNPQVFFFF